MIALIAKVASASHTAREKPRVPKKLGVDRIRTADPKWQIDISYYMTSCSAVKLSELDKGAAAA